ncbi:MAG: kelch repeat-containing protein [Deltaproteobacteria bacterium]
MQLTPDGRRTLISKDVGGERWAISRNPDGTVTGNVFRPGGDPPAFVWCEETGAPPEGEGGELMFSCFGADRCAQAPCAPEQFSFIAEVALPEAFFLPRLVAGWQTLAPLAGGARQEHPTLAFAGEIWIFGGFSGSGQVLDSVAAYDPLRGSWRSDIAPLPVPMHHANVAAVAGKIYVTGFLRAVGFAADGRVFEYDPGEDTWTEKSSMPAGTQRGASAVAAIGGRIYVAGGLRNGTQADFSVYDPAADSWEILTDVPSALEHAAVGAVDGVLYLLGGRDGGITGVSAAVHAYDTASGEWALRADIPTPRGGVAGAVLGGRIYVLGGEGNPAPGSRGVFDDVEVYDPVSNTWEVLAPMPFPRHGMGAAGLFGQIFVPGGADQQAFGAVDTVDALTPE